MNAHPACLLDGAGRPIALTPNRIGLLRIQRGLTLREAAKQIGITQSVLHAFEQGSDVRLSTATKIAVWANEVYPHCRPCRRYHREGAHDPAVLPDDDAAGVGDERTYDEDPITFLEPKSLREEER